MYNRRYFNCYPCVCPMLHYFNNFNLYNKLIPPGQLNHYYRTENSDLTEEEYPYNMGIKIKKVPLEELID